jgi:hypothetical protein
MKKNRLESEYEFDFELIGIVCNKKEYKLAWHLNEVLKINLKKQDDIKIQFANNSSILISNFLFESEFVQIELLQNKLLASGSLKNQLLMPELKQFDFFIKIKDETDSFTSENVSGSIRDIPIIEYSMHLNFDTLKSKENLLY